MLYKIKLKTKQNFILDNNLDIIYGEDLLSIIKKINIWWNTKTIPDEFLEDKKRRIYFKLIKHLEERRIINIIGPKRTGKTTLMYQLMDYLISTKKINPKNILFFSGDDLSFRSIENIINKIITIYFEDYLKKDYYKEKIYIFIDEIHKIHNWELWLKRFYDLKYNIKFIISGSSVAKIRKEQRDSLVGRILDFPLFPMSFEEFYEFNDFKLKSLNLDITKINNKLFEDLNNISLKDKLNLKKYLDIYLLVGGFPEWFEIKNTKLWFPRLKEDIIKRIVYDDIVSLYNIKNSLKLENLVYLLSNQQSQLYSYNSLSDVLRMDNEIVQKYIYYLKESFLFFEIPNYGFSKEKQLRKKLKPVLVDNGLKNAIERISDLDDITETSKGLIIESLVLQHFAKLAYINNYNLFYWNLKKEVDLIIKISSKLIAIEVKYKNKIRIKEIEGLLSFMNKHKLKSGIVVSKDTLKIIKVKKSKIYIIPAFLFLLFEAK